MAASLAVSIVTVVGAASPVAASPVAPQQRAPIYLGPPWGPDRIDQRQLPLDHRYTPDETGAGVTVYVIDGGIRTSHHEFGGRAVAGYSAFPDAPASDSGSCANHGTKAAAIVAGATVGVARKARIVSVRVYDKTCNTTADAIAAGVDWITAHHSGPSVVSMSLSHEGDAEEWGKVDRAVGRSIASGVTYVVAAGNWFPAGTDACYFHPAVLSAAITVGATNDSDSRDTGYSNYGRCVDIFAPGTNIVSAGYASDNSYSADTGTSFATPLVAGVAALYLQSRRSATPAAIASAIISSATPGVVTNAGPGSSNRLLYSRVAPTVALSASRAWAGPGQPVTLIAHLSTPIDDSTYFVRIINATTGQVVRECVSGTVCAVAVSSPRIGAHAYVAHVDRGRGGPAPYPILSASATVRVVWAPAVSLPAPGLNLATISFHTNNEDRDYDTDLRVEVYARDGRLVAVQDGIGFWQRFADGEDDGPYNLIIRRPAVTARDLHGGHLRIVVIPNGHDTWRFDFSAQMTFGTNTRLTVNRVGVQMSQNHQSYSWPIT